MEIKMHRVGKHDLQIMYDRDEILRQIEEERADFHQDAYQKCGEVGYEDGYLSREEYDKNLDAMIVLLDEITTDQSLVGFIENAPKKKNGTFYKGRITFREKCENTVFIEEWHNTWIYNVLNVSAIEDKVLLLSYIRITDTPG